MQHIIMTAAGMAAGRTSGQTAREPAAGKALREMKGMTVGTESKDGGRIPRRLVANPRPPGKVPLRRVRRRQIPLRPGWPPR
jgi:hypothetical protein